MAMLSIDLLPEKGLLSPVRNPRATSSKTCSRQSQDSQVWFGEEGVTIGDRMFPEAGGHDIVGQRVGDPPRQLSTSTTHL